MVEFIVHLWAKLNSMQRALLLLSTMETEKQNTRAISNAHNTPLSLKLDARLSDGVGENFPENFLPTFFLSSCQQRQELVRGCEGHSK